MKKVPDRKVGHLFSAMGAMAGKEKKKGEIFVIDILDDRKKVCYNSKLREKFFSNFAMPWAAPHRRENA